MTKEDYYRIRNEVYKSVGKDTFDFDLMMVRIISKAVEEEREACANMADECVNIEKLGEAIRARGACEHR